MDAAPQPSPTTPSLKQKLQFAVRKFLARARVISEEEKILNQTITKLEDQVKRDELKDVINKL